MDLAAKATVVSPALARAAANCTHAENWVNEYAGLARTAAATGRTAVAVAAAGVAMLGAFRARRAALAVVSARVLHLDTPVMYR